MGGGLLRILFLGGVVAFVSACGEKVVTVSSSEGSGPTFQGPSETTYCTLPGTVYAPATSITGTALYNRREPYVGPPSGLGFADPAAGARPASQHPIRYAEIRVTDAGGNLIQCGETLADGSFSVDVPRGNATYTVSINSRAYNDQYRVSVLNSTEQNRHYSLSGTINAGNLVTVAFGSALVALADGDTLGGAFNILDQILVANEYLRSKASAALCAPFSGCRAVSTGNPLPKVVVYWTKGFNPNSYFGSTSGLSFYLPGYSRLFILGGVSGDTDVQDTDHFDNSVILHEYGHFLEDVVSVSDSPGGFHNGNKIIDPRLAWSEGWGNFFQAAVIQWDPNSSAVYHGRYLDTLGNADGTPSIYFNVNLESLSTFDTPTTQGEGNFREFSVTRLLWDVIDTAGDTQNTFTDSISDRFVEIWAALTSTTSGFAFSGFSFRNVGLLHLIQQDFASTNWSALRGMERHDGDTLQFGQFLSASGCGAPPNLATYFYALTPLAGDSASYSSTNLFRNNDFYHLRVATSGTYTLQLVYRDQDAVGVETDLDLYLYTEDYTFGNSSDVLRSSRQDPDGTAATVETESVSLSLSSSSNYMINVNVYTGSGSVGGAAYYNLKLTGPGGLNGAVLCPAVIPPL